MMYADVHDDELNDDDEEDEISRIGFKAFEVTVEGEIEIDVDDATKRCCVTRSAKIVVTVNRRRRVQYDDLLLTEYMNRR